MKVILKANWFVEGRRIRRSLSARDPVEVPDELRDKLPKSAVIIEPDEPAPEPEAEPEPENASEVMKAAAKAGDGEREVSEPTTFSEMAARRSDDAIHKAREVLAQEPPKAKGRRGKK